MTKTIIITTILLIGTFSSFTKKTEFRLQSFDGTIEVIHVSPDYEKNILTISVLKDILKIKNCTYIKEIKLLNSQFLKVVYGVRVGTGMHMSNAIILCISAGKICRSLHITSSFNEEFINFEKIVDNTASVDVKTSYEATFNLTKYNSEDYKLDISVHNEKSSKIDSRENYNRNENISLNFDPVEHIFYESLKKVSEKFIIYDPVKEDIEKYLVGNFQTITLPNWEYFYIKGRWYEKADGNSLLTYTFKP